MESSDYQGPGATGNPGVDLLLSQLSFIRQEQQRGFVELNSQIASVLRQVKDEICGRTSSITDAGTSSGKGEYDRYRGTDTYDSRMVSHPTSQSIHSFQIIIIDVVIVVWG